LHEASVNLTHNTVERNVRLGPNQHANGDGEELIRVEKALANDPKVQAEIAKLKLPEGTIVACDPWIYGQLTGPALQDLSPIANCLKALTASTRVISQTRSA
jgi:Cu2+-containing amine oxidase